MKYIAATLLLFSSVLNAEDVKILLHIHFVDELAEIPGNSEAHPEYVGMYRKKKGICHVWLQKPEDFFDYGKIGVLGHETMHCYKGPHTKEYLDKINK